MSDVITFASSMFPSTARVLGFRGFEAISRPYRFEVSLAVRSEAVEFELLDAVGTRGRLLIESEAAGPPAVFAGVLGDVEIAHEFGGFALFRVALVPRLSDLARSTHSRVFTKKRVPEVIQAVLAEGGVTDVELRLVGAYDVEEHICQYRESDLDFISRWMEREGIFYYFEHGEGGETLILSDSVSTMREPLGRPVRYAAGVAEDWSGRGVFRSFAGRTTNLPAAVKLRDYDYTRPTIELSGAAPVSPSGSGEVSLFGERFWSPAAGQRLARIRAEELLARQSIFHAVGTRTHLSTGHTFELEDHPRASFNAPYLVVEAHHHGNQAVDSEHFRKILDLDHDELYVVDLTAIPAKTQFRPASVTPWPRIYGYELGNVDGAAASEYAQIDSHGRYAVKLKFDESELKDGNASTWVRMMQPHGGGTEGFHFPLRKGTEVVIAFVGGDPDRPVISGVVPNALTPSAVTSGNVTKNVIQTGGRNRLELDDQAGQQRVTLSTPHSNTYLRMGAPNDDHNMICKTDGQGLIDTGGNLDIKVGGSKTETVGGSVTETYGGTKTETVGGAVTETYGSAKTETIAGALTQAVTGAVTETYSSTKTEAVTGAVTETYSSTKTETVTGAVTESYMSTKDVTVTGAATETYAAGMTRNVTGFKTETINGPFSSNIVGPYALVTTGPTTKKVHGPYTKIIDDENVTVYKGVKSTTFIGAANSNNLGLFNDNKLGGQVSLFAGLMLDINLVAKLGITLGAQFTFTAGVKLDIDTAVDLKYTPVGISTRALQMEIDEVRCQLDGINLELAALHTLL
jgi:type VI secretion system secreted protein VgrG